MRSDHLLWRVLWRGLCRALAIATVAGAVVVAVQYPGWQPVVRQWSSERIVVRSAPLDDLLSFRPAVPQIYLPSIAITSEATPDTTVLRWNEPPPPPPAAVVIELQQSPPEPTVPTSDPNAPLGLLVGITLMLAGAALGAHAFRPYRAMG